MADLEPSAADRITPPSLTKVVAWLSIASLAVTLSLVIRGENGQKSVVYAFRDDHVMAEVNFLGWSNVHRVELDQWRVGERMRVPLVVIAPWRAVSLTGRPDSVAEAAQALGGGAQSGATSASVVGVDPRRREFTMSEDALAGLRTIIVSSMPFALPAAGVFVVHESAITTPGVSSNTRDAINWGALVASSIAFYLVLVQRRGWWLLAAAPPIALTTPPLFTSFVIDVPWISFAATMAILISGLSLFRPAAAPLRPVTVESPAATPPSP